MTKSPTTKPKAEPIDVVFAFDTTGSMSACLGQVRRNVKETVKRLFSQIPELRVGIVAISDYCDAKTIYDTKWLDLTDDETKVVKFVETVEDGAGGDSPECYELALHEARTKSWRSGRAKVFCLIADDVPHGPEYPLNTKRINWRNELGLLHEAGIHVYAVQALNRKHATHFYSEIAEKTAGVHLTLDQFADINTLIMAVCYKQKGESDLEGYEKEVKERGKMNRNVDKMFSVLLGRAPASTFKAADLTAVPPGRFQIIDVDVDAPIKEVCSLNRLKFKTGRGFYQFTKAETIQDYKEIILREKASGDMFTGARARELLDLPESGTVRMKPKSLEKYEVFVQSTSVNRKIKGGTKFLYEVEDYAS